MNLSASEKLLTSISNAVERATDHGRPVDSIEEAVQIQRAHPNENVTLEDIVEEFELQAEVRKTLREDESNNRLNAEAVDRWADEGGASSNRRTSDVTLIQIGVHAPTKPHNPAD